MNEIKKEIARSYHCDSIDFQARFDHLWERELHKSGRVKTFTDLTMAFECTLKCHAILSHKSENPEEVYNAVRRCSHDISKLCAISNLENRDIYDSIFERLGNFSI